MRTAKKTLILKRPVKGWGFYAPRYSPGTHRFIRMISRLYLRCFEKVGRIEIQGLDPLIDGFSEFNRGTSRLIILFRHPSRKDPTVLSYTLNMLLPRLAKKAGRPLEVIPHARFLYGKDVLNWAGPAAAWAFPRLGYIPIQNLGANKEGMNLLRKELQEGQFPIILAPEGQVTYHMNHCEPLASGFASLAQWGLDSGKDVIILPLVLGYKYGGNPEDFTRHVLALWQKETGQTLSGTANGASVSELLYECMDKTLAILEDFYRITADKPGEKESSDSAVPYNLAARIERVCQVCLKTAEDLAGLHHGGTILERVFRVRYEGMKRLYCEEGDPENFPALKRNITDFRSLEARIFIRHSQIADVLEYMDPGYITPPCAGSRLSEFALDLLDVINRLRGGDINSRYYPTGHRAVVRAGAPIRVRSFSPEGLKTRQSRQDLNNRIRQILEDMSRELNV